MTSIHTFNKKKNSIKLEKGKKIMQVFKMFMKL